MRTPVEDFWTLNEPRNVTLISATHGVNEFFSIALPPILPFLVADLDITYAQAGLLLTVFFVMYSIFQLPAGMLADRIGKKRLLVGGLFIMIAGIGLAVIAQTYSMLVIAQIVAGIGGSTYHPTGMAMISDFETATTEGKAMGVFGFGGTTGIAAAPLIIGGLATVWSWRIGLAAAAAIGLIFTTVFIIVFSDSSTPRSRTKMHKPGLGAPGRLINRFRRLLAVPITWRIAMLLLLTVLVSLQTRAIMTFTTSFVSTSTELSVGISNVVFFVMLAAGGIASLGAGSLADRMSRWQLGILVSMMTGVLISATVVVALVGDMLPAMVLTVGLLALFAVIGLVMYAVVPVKNAIISSQADRSYSGSLFGLTQTASAVGSASGPAIIGVIATWGGMHIAFPLIGSISLAMAAAFFIYSRT